MKKILIAFLAVAGVGIVLFFTLVPGWTDRSMNPVIEHEPYVVSDRAKELHKQLIIGDWHADSLLWNRDLGKEHDYSHVDLPRLAKGNVSLQMFTTVTKSPRGLNNERNETEAPDDIKLLVMGQRWPLKTWDSLTERALYQAAKLHRFETENPDNLMIIKSKSELAEWRTARENNPSLVGGLIGTEGSHALDGKLENIHVLYDAGFRMMSLQHFFDNKLGGSLHGISKAGLTQFGRDAVNAFNKLNIMIDVSHSSEQVVADVLEISTTPLIVSHTGFKGHCDTARNISDTLMQRIAAKGGLIGVGYWDSAICATHPRDIADAIIYGTQTGC